MACLVFMKIGVNQILVSYSKSGQVLFYQTQNDTYIIMGAIDAPKGQVSEGQKFIEKLVERISFKK